MNLVYDTRNWLVNAMLRGTSSSHAYDAEGVRQSSIFGSQITIYTTNKLQ